jgi:UDP-glucose 4-epimerase
MKSLEHSTGNKIINLGTGQGTTVLQLVNAFNEINDLNLSYSFTNERSEDLAISYADVTLAQELLDWSSEHSLEDMCKDSWRSICV